MKTDAGLYPDTMPVGQDGVHLIIEIHPCFFYGKNIHVHFPLYAKMSKFSKIIFALDLYPPAPSTRIFQQVWKKPDTSSRSYTFQSRW